MCVTKAISMLEQINDILQNTVITPYTATVKLLISFLLGAVIGIERQFRRREAGNAYLYIDLYGFDCRYAGLYLDSAMLS